MYGRYVLIRLDNRAWIPAIAFGPLLVRVTLEPSMFASRACDRLEDMYEELVALNEKTS